MKQRIFIIGASGNIGRELIKQIVQKDWSDFHRNPTQIVGLTNSTHYIFDSNGVDSIELMKMSFSKENAIETLQEKWERLHQLTDLLWVIKNAWMDWEIIFVDVTAWKKPLLTFHREVIRSSKNYLVTANKNPISLYTMSDFNELTEYHGRYDTNTTVMWWAGALNFINERKEIGDSIEKIEWIFSGTLGFILSELEKGQKTFSAIVQQAKDGWYTEPNPWDDLNGLDVARKLLILARYAWYDVQIKDVKIRPLIDKKYALYEWEDFFDAIKEEDSIFSATISELKKERKTLRYVWKLEIKNGKLDLEVWLESVEKTSDLWTLSGTFNIAIIETEILRTPLPHVIKSRWAWREVTAGAIRVGILKMLQNGTPRT